VSITYKEEILLTTMVCGKCGISFALPENYREKRQEDGGTFYCPNGDPSVYRETDLQRVRKELEAQKLETIRNRDRYFAEQREHEKTQKKMTRLKKRTAAGVCPCCQRTFQQLSRHMKTKHVEFVKEHGIPVPEPGKVA
jgi:hypothetical protein